MNAKKTHILVFAIFALAGICYVTQWLPGAAAMLGVLGFLLEIAAWVALSVTDRDAGSSGTKPSMAHERD